MGRTVRAAKVIEPTYQDDRGNAVRNDCPTLPTPAPPRFNLFAAGMAAFCVYFAMYGFRKPIMAVGFADQAGLWPGLD